MCVYNHTWILWDIFTCKEQLDCMEWDIWYDFFGIPQVSGSEKHMDGQVE